MQPFRLLASGAYRVSVAFINLLDTAGYAHRSDYWGGDNQPISRDRNYASTKRQKRWRRRRIKSIEPNQQDSDSQDLE